MNSLLEKGNKILLAFFKSEWNPDEVDENGTEDVDVGVAEDVEHVEESRDTEIKEFLVSIHGLVSKKRELEKNNVILEKQIHRLKRELHETKVNTSYDQDTIFILCLSHLILLFVTKFYL